jgi:hypothetical protein
MKKLALVPILAAAVLATGCFKVASETAVKNDGSATVKLSMSLKSEVIQTVKAQIDQAIEMLGDEHPELAKAKEHFDKMEAAFDEKKAAAEWKKLGLEVTKSSSSDKDGWKGFEVEGSAKNVAAYNKQYAESRKSSKNDDAMGPDPSAFSVPHFPKFYKTDQPNVAKVVLAWREPSPREARMGDLENMTDEMKEQIEMSLDQARSQMSLDDLKVEMKLKLPGKILSVSNCKQDGDDGLLFQFLGSGLSVDSIAKVNQLPTATFQFDPKEFKIPLEDEPKVESRPTSRKAEKPKKDEEEKKNKDEDKDKDK